MTKIKSITTFVFLLFILQCTIAQNPDSINIAKQLKYAQELSSNFKLDSALLLYENLYMQDSTLMEALISMEKLYSKTNQFLEAYNCAKKLKDIYPEKQYYKVRSALLLITLGEEDKALKILKPLAVHDTTNTFLLNQIAKIYMNENLVDSAMLYLNMSCQLKATPTNLITGTQLLIRNDKNLRALMFLNKYYNPVLFKNKPLSQIYAKTLYDNDSLKKAYTILDNLQENGDFSPNTTRYLGLCCWQLSYNKKAIENLECYISKDSTNIKVYYALAECYKKIRMFKEAITYMEKSLDLYKSDPNTLNLMYQGIADCYFAMEDYDNSIKTYNTIIKNQPLKYSAEYNIALIYDINKKDIDKAIKHYKKTIALIGNDAMGKDLKVKNYCLSRVEELKVSKFWNAQNNDSITEAKL